MAEADSLAPEFHRTGTTNPNGKLVMKRETALSEKTAADLDFVARASGKTPAEYVRSLIEHDLYGRVWHIETLVQGSVKADQMNAG